MRHANADFKSIADHLQDAAADPARWPFLLHQISQAVGGAGAALFALDERRSVLPCSDDLLPSMEAYGRARWNEQDVRFKGLPTLLNLGIVRDQDLFSQDEMRVTPYYQDFLAPFGLQWFCGLGFRANKGPWCLSIQRKGETGPFQNAEAEAVRFLARPLSDAATLAVLMEQARLPVFGQALDYVSQAAIILDQAGRIAQINEAAERLIGRHVDLSQRKLRLAHPQSRAAFDALLRNALAQDTSLGRAPSQVDVLDDSRRLLRVRTVNLQASGQMIFGGGYVLLLLTRVVPSLATILMQTYHLSRSETAIVQAVAGGQSVKQIASERRTKPETIRSQLKAVFSKTGTTSQSQIAALAARLQRPDEEA